MPGEELSAPVELAAGDGRSAVPSTNTFNADIWLVRKLNAERAFCWQSDAFTVDGVEPGADALLFVPDPRSGKAIALVPPGEASAILSDGTNDGTTVSGIVVDVLGRPVPGIDIEFAIDKVRTVSRDGPVVSRVTDDRGEFLFADCVPVGNHSLHLSDALGPLCSREVRATSRGVRVRLQIETGDTLRGVVLDGMGAPVTGIGVVAAVSETGAEYYNTTYTDSRGRFVMRRQQGVPDTVAIGVEEVQDARIRWELERMRWGEARTIHVNYRFTEVIAVTRASGTPVLRYYVQTRPAQQAGVTHVQRLRRAGDGYHEGGRVRVSFGEECEAIRVVPEDPKLWRSEWVAIRGVGQVRIELPEARDIDVVVSERSTGELVPFAQVAVVGAGAPSIPGWHKGVVSELESYVPDGLAASVVPLLAKTRANDRGQAHLDVPDDGSVYEARAWAPGFATGVEEIHPGEHGRIVVRVERMGEVRVAVAPDVAWTKGIGIAAVKIPESNQSSVIHLRAGGEGGVRTGALPAGRYAIHPVLRELWQEPALTEFDVVAGGVVDVRVDLSAWRPGVLDLTVSRHVEPTLSDEWTLELYRYEKTWGRWAAGAPTFSAVLQGDPGHITVSIPPGRYRAIARTAWQGQNVALMCPAWLTIHAGQTAKFALSLRRYPIALDLVGADGRPMPGCELHLEGPFLREVVVTDSSGGVRLPWGPADLFTVRCQGRQWRVEPQEVGAEPEQLVMR